MIMFSNSEYFRRKKRVGIVYPVISMNIQQLPILWSAKNVPKATGKIYVHVGSSQ